MKLPSANDVAAAAALLADVVIDTPLTHSLRLSRIAGTDVLLKREDLQHTRSYKLRGAYTALAALAPTERAGGVICASAGNHASGLAYACALLDIPCQVFLPDTTPRQKRRAIARFGASKVDIVIGGSNYADSAALALATSHETGKPYIHAFDSPHTIAGQGSLALELPIEKNTTVIVPLGGGGLAAGVALWLKANHPETKVIAVEPAGAASMTSAIEAGHPVNLESVDTFVDGAAVSRVGEHCFPLVRDLVDEICVIPEGAVASEMMDLYSVEGIIAEPAGALASAAVAAGLVLPTGPAICVLSGGNNDLTRYSEVQERALVYKGLRHYFLVNFPQTPGALRHFLDDVLGPDDDIVLFDYIKRSNREVGPALVGIEIDQPESLPALIERMKASPLDIEVLPASSPILGLLV